MMLFVPKPSGISVLALLLAASASAYTSSAAAASPPAASLPAASPATASPPAAKSPPLVADASPPPESRPLGALELGLFPAFSQAWLHCACPGPNTAMGDTSTLGGGVTMGYRYGGFLLSAYGEFGRSVEAVRASHAAVGAFGQFDFVAVPIAARLRAFHDVWSLPGGGLPTRYLSGFGFGLDAVIGTTHAKHHQDKDIGYEFTIGGDVADLGTFSDLSGPSDVDAYAIRFLLGLRMTIDTRLGLH